MKNTIKTFNSDNIKELRTHLSDVVREMEQHFGIKCIFGNAAYTSDTMKLQFKMILVDPAEQKTAIPENLLYRNNVKRHGWKFGINESMLGKTAVSPRNGRMTLIGCADRIKKYSLVFQLANGKIIFTTTSYLSKLQ